MVVHEPCDLSGHPPPYTEGAGIYHPHLKKVRYWRQAVPERSPLQAPRWSDGGGWRPTLGTLGFDFPWKNYDLLAAVTGELGWNLRIVGQVTPERQHALHLLNQRTFFDGYVDDNRTALAILETCDANAFIYTCANSGTSGAIRIGIGAGKPVIAAKDCRQFRDLQAGDSGILWAQPTAADLDDVLGCCGGTATVHGYDLDICRFAHQERWPLLGAKYAALYREVVNG